VPSPVAPPAAGSGSEAALPAPPTDASIAPGMADEERDDPESTLVRAGKGALTFTEMAAFVRDLEARPTDRLLADLPGLMTLPETRYGLVLMVLRRRTRPGGVEGAAIRERLLELRSGSADPAVLKRIDAFFARSE
jgi:hypothetical protein